MREYLFRGKRKDNGEWKYGSYVYQYDCHLIYLTSTEGEYGFDNYHVDPETVGQYTGLTDKNGVKIFEGDIVVCDRHINDVFDKKKFLVRECDFRFGLVGESLSGNEISGDEWEFAEVIGNIHDNPELLKEGGEE